MKRTTILSLVRIGLLCAEIAACAAAHADEQPDPDSGCVKTRCFTPTCDRYNPGNYYMQCPPGVQPPPRSQQTAPPAADGSSADGTRDPALQSAPAHLDPAAVQAFKGDWEFRLGASPKPMAVLHLRPGETGTLEGSLEQSIGPAQQVPLQDVEVNGQIVTYTTPGGRKFRGTLSNDGQTIVGDAGSPTWQREKP